MKLSKTSAWTQEETSRFLRSAVMPMRIATMADEFPTLCSVWFLFDDESGDLLCVSHKNSQLVTDLQRNNRCAFEIAPNEPPYRGVRGKAVVTLTSEQALETLTNLLRRYLGGTDSHLAKWLLGRIDDEYVLRLTPVRLTSWDYAERMSK
ncbi:MAG: pyridoxamine 5'-phosphate oxidase family protein [Pseudomonadales bacterium]|nr:pyridoxamine 5'-phosphate oxidase family protein [Pseudomonadales bacterium]